MVDALALIHPTPGPLKRKSVASVTFPLICSVL